MPWHHRVVKVPFPDHVSQDAHSTLQDNTNETRPLGYRDGQMEGEPHSHKPGPFHPPSLAQSPGWVQASATEGQALLPPSGHQRQHGWSHTGPQGHSPGCQEGGGPSQGSYVLGHPGLAVRVVLAALGHPGACSSRGSYPTHCPFRLTILLGAVNPKSLSTMLHGTQGSLIPPDCLARCDPRPHNTRMSPQLPLCPVLRMDTLKAPLSGPCRSASLVSPKPSCLTHPASPT